MFTSLFRSGSFIKTAFILCYLMSLGAKVLDLHAFTSLLNVVFAFMAVYVTLKEHFMTKPVICELTVILLLLLIHNLTGHSQLYAGWEGANERGIFLQTFLLFVHFIIPCYLSKKGKLNDGDIIFLFVFTFFYAVMMYFKFLSFVSSLNSITLGVGESTNNMAYIFVCLSPFVFLLKDTKKQFIILFIAFIFVFISAKRGAILIGLLFLFYYLYNMFLKGKFSVRRILIMSILFGVILISGYYIMLSNDYIYEKFIRTTEGYSSGRDRLAEDILGYVFGAESTIFNLFFGSGIGTSVKVAGNWAHNDWLELLSMSGLLGVFLYLKLYISMWNFIKKSFKDRYYLIFSSAAMMLFVMSFFSMAFFVSTSTTYSLMVLMGYSYGFLTTQNQQDNCYSRIY